MPNKLDEILLPEGLVWTDEFTSSQTSKSATRTLTGALVVQTGVKIEGRPVTLTGTDSGWINHADLVLLRNYVELNPDKVMVLNFRDVEQSVIIDSTNGPALSAQPIIDYSTPEAEDWYTMTLKLLTTAGV